MAKHAVKLTVVSRAQLAKLQAYKRSMGWTFPWASSFGGDFNFDFSVGLTEQQQREGTVEYNYQPSSPVAVVTSFPETVAQFAAMVGTDAPSYMPEGPGLSAFGLEAGAAYHAYSTYCPELD